jgi:small-conductance mechanosensitive channel
VDAILARMNDDQVRRLLIAELQQSAVDPQAQVNQAPGGLSGAILRFESICHLLVNNAHRLVVSLPEVPVYLGLALDRLTDFEGPGRFVTMLLLIAVFLAAGLAVEWVFRRATGGLRQRLADIPGMDGPMKFVGALLQAIPDVLGLMIFTLTPLLIFFVSIDRSDRSLRLLFLAVLLTVVVIRLGAIVLKVLLAPQAEQLRLIALQNQTATYLYRRLLMVVGFLTAVWFTLLLINYLEVPPATQIWMVLLTGTTVIAILAAMVWANRQTVSQHMRASCTLACDGRSWVQEQFSAMWHLLALAYLVLLWLLMVGRLILSFEVQFRGDFILSLLIVPIYLALDRMAQWCVISVFHGPKSGDAEAAASVEAAEDPEAPATEDNEGYIVIASRVVRVLVFVAVALWLLDLWGLPLAIGDAAIQAAFSITVTLLLAHIAWELISNAISRKLAKAQPDVEDNKDDEDEWGGAAAQDRSFTLLPMLRKFIGAVMVVMVTLIVLSSLGINIGPLLAGAGVIGLAIGFGAQKLVRDILSGIFFLMDDAFRVGEYLDAGGISGTVEQITLRTIKLRHHRGMLQIVPLGDLKSITNFMRGGMVVKFDLKLPYDTDIDKVRKIIKKVGKKMLLDEELGPDFIKPLKSQGVRSVGDSVMTFRAKFTARPGTHFVIRREAYKHITAALEKAGIHYAHRKVIVDLAPDLAHKMEVGPANTNRAGEKEPDRSAPDKRVQILDVAAAAALDTIVEEESTDPKAGKKKK